MNGKEYSDFLKVRRTPKLFEQNTVIPENHRQMLIDAVNFAPAQNGTRNFITLLIEDKEIQEWLVKNIFYMVPKFSPQLNRDMPKEYQYQIISAPMVVLYLEANIDLPIHKDQANITKTGDRMTEPDSGDIAIRNINIGMNMAFLANQAYTLNYDVSFVGCTRGLRTVMGDRELRGFLNGVYYKYNVLTLAGQHGMAPSYAVCIGKGLPLDNDLAGQTWQDGYFNNVKKHNLKEIEHIRTLS